MAKDYYKVLGIERDASGASIKEAYRKLAFEYHPDRNRGDPSALERMKEINEAYAVLSDAAKRQRYDALRQEYGTSAYDRFRQGYSEQDIFRGSDINQIFEEMAKAFGFRNFDEVFRESYGTTYQSYQFRRPGMFGRFIIIRPGGHRYTTDRETGRESLGGGEERAERGGFLGKLAGSALRYLAGRIIGNATGLESLNRKGSIEITPEKAEKGGKVTYSDPETSRQITITVPAGTREGQVLRLRGMGVTDRIGQRGDLYLMVHVKFSILARLKGLLTGKEWSQWAK